VFSMFIASAVQTLRIHLEIPSIGALNRERRSRDL